MPPEASLKRSDLFQSLDEPEIAAVLSHARIHVVPARTTIFEQGQEATSLYVLVEGEVELSIQTSERAELMTSRIDKEGATFGMPALLEPFRYNVRAVSLRETRLLVIDAPSLRELMNLNPKMGMEIMKRLASVYFERLNQMRSGISNLLRSIKRKGV